MSVCIAKSFVMHFVNKNHRVCRMSNTQAARYGAGFLVAYRKLRQDG